MMGLMDFFWILDLWLEKQHQPLTDITWNNKGELWLQGTWSHLFTSFISVTLGLCCVVSFGFTYVANVSQQESDRQTHQSLNDHYKSHQSTTDHYKYSDHAIKFSKRKTHPILTSIQIMYRSHCVLQACCHLDSFDRKHPKAHNLYIDSFAHLFSIFLHFAFLHQSLLMQNTNSLNLQAIFLFSSKWQEPHQRSQQSDCTQGFPFGLRQQTFYEQPYSIPGSCFLSSTY